MSAIYDNWERLVAAAVKKQQLWELFHQPASRSPSVLSQYSDSTSSFPDLSFRIPSQHPKLVVVSDFWPDFHVKDAALASVELLGTGTFGRSYLATMDDEKRFAVKRLPLKSESISEMDFKRIVEIVGVVRHQNVVALRAYYSSPVERLLLYDFYSNGSVHSLLHGENRADLDWQTRGKIAVGAARGIAEIHRQLGGILVHGNIKASNIFLDQQLYGCVSDLGSTLMTQATFAPSAYCYPPEVKNTQNVSQASDVYGFGILLLELLTRKTSVRIHGGPVPVNLVKLVKSVKNQERAANVFDPDLLKHPSISEQMVKMLQIGIKCVAKSARKRPNIFEVLKMLEDVVALDQANSSQEEKLVFVDDVNPIFDLEGLLRASAEVLGKGSSGTSYKATLDESTLVVKRLRDVPVTLEDFQQHVELFGRMNHINVGKLRAYYYARSEKLLVYDYYSQGSISALLHGTTDVPRTPLDWESRVKIALGAARGIAYIHIQPQKLVLGNVKSRNIFLNAQNHCIIAFDAGFPKLMNLDKPWPLLVSEYCAPEVAISGKVLSQASDVYSFGVVLLELVCGRESKGLMDYDPSASLAEWLRSVDRSEWSAEVLDVECLRTENEEAMIQVLQMAMECLSTDPEHRPNIFELVKVLEEISGELSVQSGFEYILEDLLPMLPL